MSTSRLEAFSDGVLAIAITLLVLNIHVPAPHPGTTLGHELLVQWPSYAAYVVSFLTIGIIWVNHHAMIRRLGSVDHAIMVLNLVLLLCVAALPFTTALVAAYLKQGHGQHLAAAIYSGSFLLMSVAFAVTNRHVLFPKGTSPSSRAAAPDSPHDPRAWRRRTGPLRNRYGARSGIGISHARDLRCGCDLLRAAVRERR